MFLTHAQRALLRKNTGKGVFAVSIEHTSGTLRYCTGHRAIQIGANWYDPRGMTLPELNITTGGTSARLSIADDPDDTSSLERLNYSSRFASKSGGLMWWYFLVWGDDGSGWNEIYSYAWTMTQCAKSERQAAFDFILDGATGTYPRAALEIIGRGCGLTYADELCLNGNPKPGAYDTCDGSMADCVLRGREDSYRGAVLALEPGKEIEFFYRESPYRIGSSSYTPPPPPGGEETVGRGSMTVHQPNAGPDDFRVVEGDLNIVQDYIETPPPETM